jgi:uncharacterized protein YukE
MKEDPTRDPASEERDDHASEPMATPETDALAPSQGRIRTMREYIDELEVHARRLERQRDELTDRWERSANAFLIEQGRREAVERQRDELMEALEDIAKQKILDEVEDPVCCDFEDGYTTCVEVARAAIAAVKGGTP